MSPTESVAPPYPGHSRRLPTGGAMRSLSRVRELLDWTCPRCGAKPVTGRKLWHQQYCKEAR